MPCGAEGSRPWSGLNGSKGAHAKVLQFCSFVHGQVVLCRSARLYEVQVSIECWWREKQALERPIWQSGGVVEKGTQRALVCAERGARVAQFCSFVVCKVVAYVHAPCFMRRRRSHRHGVEPDANGEVLARGRERCARNGHVIISLTTTA